MMAKIPRFLNIIKVPTNVTCISVLQPIKTTINYKPITELTEHKAMNMFQY